MNGLGTCQKSSTIPYDFLSPVQQKKKSDQCSDAFFLHDNATTCLWCSAQMIPVINPEFSLCCTVESSMLRLCHGIAGKGPWKENRRYSKASRGMAEGWCSRVFKSSTARHVNSGLEQMVERKKMHLNTHIYLKALDNNPRRLRRLTINMPYYKLFLVCRFLFISHRECS